MSVSLAALATIAGMALVTYATRAGGLWLAGRITLSPRMEAALGYVPGAVLISIVVPAVLAGGSADKIAALVTAAVAARTRNLLLSMVIGVVVVWLLRQVLHQAA